MVLRNEKWYKIVNGKEVLATKKEIKKHFAGRKPDTSYWTGDYS